MQGRLQPSKRQKGRHAFATSTRVVLASFAFALPTLQNFRTEQCPLGELQDGEVLLATRFVSVDAHLRAHTSEAQSSATTLFVGCVIEADGTASVMESKHPDFHPGDLVLAKTGWQTHVRLPASAIRPLSLDGLAEEVALVNLGTAAQTAFSGLRCVAHAQAGETLIVPAATGPLGATAGQLARTMGMWTIGIVSSQQEQAFAQQKLGFHSVLNRTSDDFATALEDACTSGVDVYLETLGGALFGAIRPLMNDGGRIVLTGTWAQYSHLLGGAAEYGTPATLEAVLRKHLVLGVPRAEAVSFTALFEHVRRAVQQGSLWSHIRVESGLEHAAHAWLTATNAPDRATTVLRL